MNELFIYFYICLFVSSIFAFFSLLVFLCSFAFLGSFYFGCECWCFRRWLFCVRCPERFTVVLCISHSSAVLTYGFLLSVSIQFIQFVFANSKASPYFLGEHRAHSVISCIVYESGTTHAHAQKKGQRKKATEKNVFEPLLLFWLPFVNKVMFF